MRTLISRNSRTTGKLCLRAHRRPESGRFWRLALVQGRKKWTRRFLTPSSTIGSTRPSACTRTRRNKSRRKFCKNFQSSPNTYPKSARPGAKIDLDYYYGKAIFAAPGALATGFNEQMALAAYRRNFRSSSAAATRGLTRWNMLRPALAQHRTHGEHPAQPHNHARKTRSVCSTWSFMISFAGSSSLSEKRNILATLRRLCRWRTFWLRRTLHGSWRPQNCFVASVTSPAYVAGQNARYACECERLACGRICRRNGREFSAFFSSVMAPIGRAPRTFSRGEAMAGGGMPLEQRLTARGTVIDHKRLLRRFHFLRIAVCCLAGITEGRVISPI